MKTDSSKHNWGGEWTEKKLDAFSKYVNAYLSIMKKNPYWKTIYFDGFAGSGKRENETEIETKANDGALFLELFGDDVSRLENMVYRGSAERVIQLPQKFDYYYFIDANKTSLESLKSVIGLKGEGLTIKYRHDNANRQLCLLADAMKGQPNRYAALVFLDPFAMDVIWDSIVRLKDTRTDLWILVPTGTIINRLLGKTGDLLAVAKLTNFFGITEQEIRDYFYKTERKTTLFGDEEVISKIPKSIEKIAELYIQRLKAIWKYTTPKPLPLYNSKNVPIFHLVFASNNPTAVKIASQIIESV